MIPDKGTGAAPKPIATRSVFFDGDLQDTEFFQRESLAPGSEVVGPAVIVEPTSDDGVGTGLDWADERARASAP